MYTGPTLDIVWRALECRTAHRWEVPTLLEISRELMANAGKDVPRTQRYLVSKDQGLVLTYVSVATAANPLFQCHLITSSLASTPHHPRTSLLTKASCSCLVLWRYASTKPVCTMRISPLWKLILASLLHPSRTDRGMFEVSKGFRGGRSCLAK